MKNSYKIFGFCSLLVLLVLGSCTDDDRIRIPAVEKAVNMRIQLDPSTQFIDAANIPNSTLMLHFFTENDDIDKMELQVDYYSSSQDSTYARGTLLTFDQADFGDGVMRDVVITTQEISEVVGIPVAEMGAGDKITLLNFTTLMDGRTYPDQIVVTGPNAQTINNTTPNILNSAATTSFTSQIVVFIACPFEADAAVGEYLITRDDFATTLDPTRPIEAQKIDDQTIRFVNLFSHPEMYDVDVIVNLASGAATVAKQPAWHCDNFGCGYGEGRVEGTGFFFSCTGFVTLDLKHTVDLGSFGTFRLEMQKQ